ncbi:MAG: hypothetical protein A2Y76_01630 [Planctomycetes bacterium RBG_13_60_9]|nr:MAG: hypothetical protein A2Y76_01630 [Planctomycetes bacterium RBG_13_60_9]
MATKAMKIWGTTATFDGVTIGEIKTVGKGKRKREIIEVFTTDSTDEQVEKISSGINNGQLTLGVVYDGEVAGVYKSLDTKFVAGTVGTLLVTMKNGSTLSMDALIGEFETPGGEAKGGMAEYEVTFEISGTITVTGA